MTSPRKSWPYWVRIVLWKTGRRTARKCVWLSLLGALLCAVLAICCVISVSAWVPKVAGVTALFAVLFFLVAIVYHRATVWVDRNGTWS
jgi:hypothetical protein